MRKPIDKTLSLGKGSTFEPYENFLDRHLKDRKLAKGYLKMALEDEDPRVFLLALSDVARAWDEEDRGKK